MTTITNANICVLLKNIAKEHKLDILILFGSRSKGTHTQDSDYDLAYLKLNESQDDFFNIRESLQEIFQELPFDLVNIQEDVLPRILYDIFYRSELIYCKDRAVFENIKDSVYFYYHDSNEIFKEYKQHFLST